MKAMGATQSDFEEHFSSLSDIALLEVKRKDLVEAARVAYDQEIKGRGIALGSESHGAGSELSSGEELVNVVAFESAEDARHAQEQLKKNGIPAFIAVAVPAAFARQAITLLDPGVSEEELAALAESAQPPNEDI
jgi:hypothetical protein